MTIHHLHPILRTPTYASEYRNTPGANSCATIHPPHDNGGPAQLRRGPHATQQWHPPPYTRLGWQKTTTAMLFFRQPNGSCFPGPQDPLQGAPVKLLVK